MKIRRKSVLFYTISLYILTLMVADAKVHAGVPLSTSSSVADWTIFVYMEASNNLNPFAISNLNSMAQVGSIAGKTNIVVQWHQPNKQGGWRYIVQKRKIQLLEHVASAHTGNCVKDLTEAAAWAFSAYPAKRNALVLWNHGVGIIDPVWGNMRSCIPMGDMAFADPYMMEGTDLQGRGERGILFDETSKTYMNNQALIDSLATIVKKLNRKIDLIAFDACLMAMVEVAFQVRKYANIFVASQEVEYADGWPYAAILAPLGTKEISAAEFAKHVVTEYDRYYKRKNYVYTQSAIDLDFIEYIKQNIDQVVMQIKLCTNQYGIAMKGLIQEARRNCVHFNTPSYIDLHSFYKELHTLISNSALKTVNMHAPLCDEAYFNEKESGLQISETVLPDNFYHESEAGSELFRAGTAGYGPQVTGKNATGWKHVAAHVSLPPAARPRSTHIENLKEHLSFGMKLIESVVFANAAAQSLKQARGISIYYPRYRIDKSYLKTQFARESLWLEFLKENG